MYLITSSLLEIEQRSYAAFRAFGIYDDNKSSCTPSRTWEPLTDGIYLLSTA